MPPRACPRISVTRLVEDESGQDLIEYALIAATVGLGTVAGVNGIASSISRYMAFIGAGFETAISSSHA